MVISSPISTVSCFVLVLFKGHNDYTDGHLLIPIIEYEKAPARYQILYCEFHPRQQVKEACRKCEKVFCDRCSTRQPCLVNKGKLSNTITEGVI